MTVPSCIWAVFTHKCQKVENGRRTNGMSDSEKGDGREPPGPCGRAIFDINVNNRHASGTEQSCQQCPSPAHTPAVGPGRCTFCTFINFMHRESREQTAIRRCLEAPTYGPRRGLCASLPTLHTHREAHTRVYHRYPHREAHTRVYHRCTHLERHIPGYTPLYTPREAHTRVIHHCYTPREHIPGFKPVIHLGRHIPGYIL